MFTWVTHSGTRYKMLKLFFKDLNAPLYGLEIAQRLKASPGTTHRELNALLERDILVKNKEGALVMYRLNTTHPYFHELKKAIHPPKKKTHRTLFISDLHLSVNSSSDLIEDLNLFLDYAEESATEIVFLGDVVEMLHGSVFATYLVHKPLFDRIIHLAYHAKVTYVVGNHDCFLDILCREGEGRKLLGAPIHFAREYINDHLNIYATHGHQYDDFSEAKGFKSSKKAQEANVAALDKLLKKMKGKSDHKDALAEITKYAEKASVFAEYVSKKKIDYSKKFEKLAAQFIDEEDFSYVVFGHTHKAQLKQLGHGIYFNTGSWKSEKKRQFVEIDKDGGALIPISELR